MTVTIRPYRVGDAAGIAALYNRFDDNPNPVVGGVTAAELEAELADRGTAAFFVAVDSQAADPDEDGYAEIVGTFGLFTNSGRRATRPGELIADMFFVAPSYRTGMTTATLFTAALNWMHDHHYQVIRLTVNPANLVAFRLYRRVGCVSIGYARPGEDGNVELINYIPLLVQTVVEDLGEDAKAALRNLNSFGCLTERRADDLGSDLVLDKDRRTVSYSIRLGPYRLDAVIDVDRTQVVTADLTGPGGSRPLRIKAPAAGPKVIDERRHTLRTDQAQVTVDGSDGSCRLTIGDGHPGADGSLIISTWPARDHRVGWRQGVRRSLQVDESDGALKIIEEFADGRLVGTVRLGAGMLRQTFSWESGSDSASSHVWRTFQTCGLRRADISIDGEPSRTPTPAGLGLAVRDASEIPAAGQRISLASAVTWALADDGPSATVIATDHVRLVHDHLLDSRLDLSQPVEMITTFTAGKDLTHVPAQPGPHLSPATRQKIRTDARAGGVISWSSSHTKIVRSPYPRSRPFGSNPRWSAGIWVSTEADRSGTDPGVGWGVGAGEPLLIDQLIDQYGQQHSTLIDGRIGVSWSVTPLESGSHDHLRLTAEPIGAAPSDDPEIVFWLTPATRPGARVDFCDVELKTDERWQRWANSAAVELIDDRWLSCRPLTPDRDAEVLVRSTSSGLLIGCVSRRHPISWLLTVADRPAL